MASDESGHAEVSQDMGPGDASSFPIVGIGASAGGLEALGSLIGHVTPSGMAFVIVQHLAPQQESALAELLSKASTMQVVTARDGMKAEPDHAYVIPPNADLAILNGVLRVLPIASVPRPHLPIDSFFRSLADDRGPFAIGVVLSGTGTDGTFGLKAIKAAGGTTFVQDPTTARYDGMPRSALAGGNVDFCLPPQRIADELTRLAGHPYLRKAVAQTPRPSEDMGQLLVLVRDAFGDDLTCYKEPTIERRVERRMALQRIERLADYVRFVRSNPEELRQLHSDLLISVTSFFRDREPFEALKTSVFPALLERPQPNAPIRVWVPGCATGEEAYSLAIVLLEFLEERGSELKVQIFGTDIDNTSIEHARQGVYPENIALDVSPERLRRFFIKKEADFQVSRRIREMVVFSKQNVVRDAPFSRMDLVSCRNLLIYLQPAAQRKVLRILNYALAPHGFLLLGTSETVGDLADLFTLLDRKTKIYRKKNVASVPLHDLGFGLPSSPTGTRDALRPVAARPTVNLQQLADRRVLERFGPPGVVINENLEILQFRGHTGIYLEPAPGAASFNLLRLARPDLHLELRRLVKQAFDGNVPVVAEGRLKSPDGPRAVSLEALPIVEPETKSKCLLVLFHEQVGTRPAAEQNERAAEPVAPGDEQADLRRELENTREYLQTTIDELESANEEMKASNEELQSSNEELQSTNEELETAKEELQSTNEELVTLNDELQSRMNELGQTNDDLHNLLVGTDSAVVIVGMDLRIRRFTQAAEKLLNLVPADIGRQVSHLDAFVGGGIEKVVSDVIERLAAAEEDRLASNRRWYSLRVTPYRTLDHSIRGAIIVLADIDLKKRSADLRRDVVEYATQFLQVIGHPLVIIDADLRVIWVNEPFYRTFEVAPEETIGMALPALGGGPFADHRLSGALAALVASGTQFHNIPMGGGMGAKVSGSRIPGLPDKAPAYLLSIEEPLGRRKS